MKFEPFTVRVKAPKPCGSFVGLMLLIEGTGLPGVLTVKVTLLEVAPPGFVTVIG
jgi:hypothetical protein